VHWSVDRPSITRRIGGDQRLNKTLLYMNVVYRQSWWKNCVLNVESIKWQTNGTVHRICWISEINGPYQSAEEPEETIRTIQWRKSTIAVKFRCVSVNSQGKWFRNSGDSFRADIKVVSGIRGKCSIPLCNATRSSEEERGNCFSGG